MIRIVGVQKSERADKEFILLQNQGSMRINLRGHCLICDEAVGASDPSRGIHVFADEEMVPAGMYVLLVSGGGEPRWARSRDGALIYYAYMNRAAPVWSRCEGTLHMLSPHHTYAERGEALLLR